MRTPIALCLAVGAVLAAPLVAAGPNPCYGNVNTQDCVRWARQQFEVLPPDVQEILEDTERDVAHAVEATLFLVNSAYCFVGGPSVPPVIGCPP